MTDDALLQMTVLWLSWPTSGTAGGQSTGDCSTGVLCTGTTRVLINLGKLIYCKMWSK